MQPELSLADTIALLERTPMALTALLGEIPERWARATPAAGEWSPFDVVGHLVDGERVNWMARTRHILDGVAGPFTPFDRTTHQQAAAETLADRLATFAALRRTNLAALVALSLTTADLERTGQHPELGEVRLGQLLATWAVHDLNHLGQVVQAMARSAAAAVGPWQAYLNILHGPQLGE